MYSRTKTIITPDQIAAIAQRAFGPTTAVRSSRELTDGFFNAAHMIELADGNRYVLKVAPPPDVPILGYERNLMRAEVEAMQLARARTSAPIPEILFVDETAELLPSSFLIMSFLAGTPLNKLRADLTPEQQAEIDRTVAGYLAQINQIVGRSFGYVGEPAPVGQPWRTTFLAMLDGIFADGAAVQAVLPRPEREMRALVAACADVLDEVSEPRLVHWDLWDGNIFVDPSTREVTGLIDFERAIWGDPLLEVQYVGMNEDGALAEGYGACLLNSPEARCRRQLYNIYIFVILIVESEYRKYDEGDPIDWAREHITGTLSWLDRWAGGERDL